MAEKFQTAAGICGGEYWNSSRSMFMAAPVSFSSCSAEFNDAVGSCYLWPTEFPDMMIKTKSCNESNNYSGSDSSIVFPDTITPKAQNSMMAFGLSSSPSSDHWNLHVFPSGNRRAEEKNLNLQDDMGCKKLNYELQSSADVINDSSSYQTLADDQDCSINGFNNPAGLSDTTSYNSYPSTLLNSLFDSDPQPQNDTLFTNRFNNIKRSPLNDHFTSSRPPLPPNYLEQQTATGGWNTPPSVFPSSEFQFSPTSILEDQKSNCQNYLLPNTHEEVQDSGSAGRKTCVNTELVLKRPRIETPSPLPTFKVRKEKLGDRVTALQQLVSPFGKTDTASVLHEAIEYIRFLHNQVTALSNPYMEAHTSQQRQVSDKPKEPKEPKQDLRSRGLCLVPISKTFPVANESTPEFWTPTFGAT